MTALDLALMQSSPTALMQSSPTALMQLQYREVVNALVNSQRGRLLRRMYKLRRLARDVCCAATALQELYTEVTFRPGNRGYKRSHEEFVATGPTAPAHE